MVDCPFCADDTTRTRIVQRNDFCTTLLSDPRLAKGHALVVPTRHVELPTDLTPDEFTAIYQEIQRLTGIMLAHIAAGVDTWQKTRPHVAQGTIKVNHVHFHVLPSKPGDELYDTAIRWTSDRFGIPEVVELDEMRQLLQL